MIQRFKHSSQSVYTTLLLGGVALAIVVGIVQAPGEAFRASLSGLQTWWQYVFPGLLPPLMLAELLAASGLLHGVAVIAEPLCRTLFRLPGAASWAVSFGWLAGIPAGAKETARLQQAGMIHHTQTASVLLLAHVPNPFLVIVIIGAGFLQSPALGWSIAAGVWCAAALATGIASRFNKQVDNKHTAHDSSLFHRALQAASDARQKDARPIGKQLADSVTNAIGLLMGVGGIMMMAAVVIQLLQRWIPGSDAWLAIPGLYEMHIGAYESSRSPLLESAPVHAAALLAAALSWTGWSGLLQARAAFAGVSGFPWGKFIMGKMLQSAIALIVTIPLAKFAVSHGSVLEAWSANRLKYEAGASYAIRWREWPEIWLAGAACLAVFLLLAVLAACIRPTPKHRRKPPPPRRPF